MTFIFIMKLKNWLINYEVNFTSPQSRRHELLERMDELNRQNINCNQCVGTCCTFEKNAMQITPLETIDLLKDLVNRNLFNDLLIQTLKSNIQKYRLDQLITVKKGTQFRRYYTCPFFNHQSLGCLIQREHKPYGCLAFNATKGLEQIGHSCQSDTSLLENIKNENNELIIKELNLDWEKLPIPVAIIEIIDRINQLPNA